MIVVTEEKVRSKTQTVPTDTVMKREKSHRGFTLVELVVVICIIGILIAFVLPGIGGAIERSHRASAMNSLREIAKAYKIYRQDNGDFTATEVTTIRDFALRLAQEGLLNDPNSYVFSWDGVATRLNTPRRDTIVRADGTTYSECWNETTTDNAFSLGVVVGLDESCPEDTTPLAYTRGLGEDGRWTNDGVFGSQGGLVVFLSGQVKWFEEVEFLRVKSGDGSNGGITHNIAEAIPEGARCLNL